MGQSHGCWKRCQEGWGPTQYTILNPYTLTLYLNLLIIPFAPRQVLDHVLLDHEKDCQSRFRLHHPHRCLRLCLLHHPLQQRDRVLWRHIQIIPQGFTFFQALPAHSFNIIRCVWRLKPGVCDDSWRIWVWRSLDKLASRGRQVQHHHQDTQNVMIHPQLWLLAPRHDAPARSSHCLWDSHHGDHHSQSPWSNSYILKWYLY